MKEGTSGLRNGLHSALRGLFFLLLPLSLRISQSAGPWGLGTNNPFKRLLARRQQMIITEAFHCNTYILIVTPSLKYMRAGA